MAKFIRDVLCKKPFTENISYIYYSEENGIIIPNGPKCHSCMNETLHNDELNGIEQVFILTAAGLAPFPIRSLISLYGMNTPFSIKDLAEIPILIACVQCIIKRITKKSTDERILDQHSSIKVEIISNPEETGNKSTAVKFVDPEVIQPENPVRLNEAPIKLQENPTDNSQEGDTSSKSTEIKRKLSSSDENINPKKTKTEKVDDINAVPSTNRKASELNVNAIPNTDLAIAEVGPDGKTSHIMLKLIDEKTNEFHFRVKPDTPMAKLRKSYGERIKSTVSTLRLFFLGVKINDDQTPRILKMKEGDFIEVYQEKSI